ncbi:hypothetical protein HYPSUDRAFT_84331 [Hypholoma sublateritium FD-334 SS-4]|uniref:G-protein coupled receptors family 2 profile 2 domain-containing protein n=1 Tax=Hypholoma sublateritium (strain FD-334 SS-4) TaxID=945553 RepID=A0A0D2MSF2_HYPSF|nr:hypothetical protein HYPSUDRAFT_84331 [Hypholoma sublateritium FD-334 SS-4]
MLPLGLKISWFILSATGWLACCIVLWAFGRTVNVQWGPVAYIIGNTLLQGAFCLGMVYRMDPFSMPRSFCIAQTIIISTGAFIISGASMAFSLATYMAVLKPKTWGDGERAFRWRNIYAVPILVFPFVGTVVHIVGVLKFDSAQPSDDIHCDSTAPEWVRLLGYAGMPILMVLPALYLSVMSAYRISRTNQHLQRARPEGEQFSLPRASRRYDTVTFMPPDAHVSSSAAAAVAAGGIVIAAPRHAQTGSGVSTVEIDDADSQVSFTFPTFANPDTVRAAAGVDKEQRESDAEGAIAEKDDEEPAKWEDEASAEGPSDAGRADSLRWVDSKVHATDDVGSGSVMSLADDVMLRLPNRYSSMFHQPKTQRPIPFLAPAVLRMILFQVAFITFQSLASISTIVDLARHRSPTPFGSQHIALELACWMPVIVFGQFPSVRRNLIPWRPLT